MRSLAFPDMFNNSRTKIVTDKEATLSNMKLILQTAYNTLYGDPGYGNSLQEVIYSTGTIMLSDIVKENIYNTLHHYIPQLIINKRDITITQFKTQMSIKIKAYNVLTQDIDIYDIDLIADGEDANQLI